MKHEPEPAPEAPEPREVHPLADLALRTLQTGGAERVGFLPQGLQELAAALTPLFGTPELRKAVRALVDVARYLEETLHSPLASQALLSVAAAAVKPLTAERAAAPQQAESLHSRGKEFARFDGRPQVKRRKTLPRGTVKATSILPANTRRV